MSEREVSFILASASPRRQKLLDEAGYKFEVFPSDIDETNFSSEGFSARKYAEKLALAKANNVAAKFPKRLVVGADTIVDFDGEIIGKAVNAEDAERIIRKLFSSPHKVITAVAIVRLVDGLELVESNTTIVYPKQMTAGQIAKHIKSKSWEDKAGAYAIQETGDEFVEKIVGSLTNVMGMPMELFGQMIEKVND